MEKYQFVPNDEDNAIEDIDAQQLRQYINDCDLLAKKIAESFERKAQTNNGLNNEKLFELINKNIESNETLLNSLTNLYKSVFDENGNPVNNQNINENILRKILNNPSNESTEYDLSFDKLNKIETNGRLMRSILDIVNENNQRNISIAELNASHSLMAPEVLHNMGFFFHYPLVVDYTIATNDVKGLSQDVQKSGYQFVEWDTSKANLPTLSAPVDLLLYKDCLNQTLEESVFSELATNVKDNGFLLAVFRTQLSSAEHILNQLTGLTTND